VYKYYLQAVVISKNYYVQIKIYVKRGANRNVRDQTAILPQTVYCWASVWL